MKIFKVDFYHTGKPKANGTKSIICRFGYGKDTQDVGTGIFCVADDWNKDTQTVVNNANSDLYNKKIAILRGKLNEIEMGANFAKKGKVDATLIKSVYEGKDRPNFGIIGLWEQSITVKRNVLAKTRNTFESLRNDTVKKKRLVRFLATLDKKEILISDIDVKFCIDFGNFLNSIISLEPARMTYARFKGLLSVQLDLGNIDNNPANSHKMATGKAKKFVWLTYEEVLKILNFDFVSVGEQTEAHRFCLQCLTGASHADVHKICLNEVQTGTNGVDYITISREKTDETCTIPIFAEVKELLSKYENGFIPNISVQRRNTHLLQVCQRVGITKKVTTHAGRHTFAMLARHHKDIAIDVVANIMGHATSRTTEKYYSQMLAETVIKGFKGGFSTDDLEPQI